jgi:molybdopterin molybdotransferase
LNEIATFLSVEQATERILPVFEPLESIEAPLDRSLGMVLAEDVVAYHDVPLTDNSAFDGYAVRAADIATASKESPIRLHVVYDLQAGAVGEAPIGNGEAVRIMTGAPVPNGADTVVGFELTDREDWGKFGIDPRGISEQDRSFVTVLEAEEKGENIRLAGEDVQKGQVALSKGTELRPGAIGVLASIGYGRVPVHRRPVVAVIPTGDEVVEVTDPILPGKVRNSHAWALESQVRRYGGNPRRWNIVPDEIDAVQENLRTAADVADLILTIGGVSMGDYDLVKNVVGSYGTVDFWQIAMRPGKPLVFGHIEGTPILGLPGNPVSGLVVFEQFGRPAVRKMLGFTKLRKPTVEAVLKEGVRGKRRRRIYARVRVERVDGGYECWPTGEQGSGIMSSMAKADGLAIISEDRDGVSAGETVTVQMLDWPDVE